MNRAFNRRGIMLGASLAAAALVVTGCASGSGDADSGEETYTIGVSFLNMQDPDTVHILDGMEEVAEEVGAEIVTVDAGGDVATELSQVEDLVTRQVDAIVMQPIDGESSQPAANLVIDAGIPLFTISTDFAEGADIAYEAYIGVDDTVAGEMQAEYLNEVLPEGGDLVFIAGTYGASWTDRRKTGYENVINDNFEIITELQAGCSRDEAQRIMEDILLRYPDEGQITAVLAQCDESAIGASSAIVEAGRIDEIQAFVSVDGTPGGLEALSEGAITATVKQDSFGQGRLAIEVVTQFLDGETIEDRNYLPFELVTAENVDEFLE